MDQNGGLLHHLISGLLCMKLHNKPSSALTPELQMTFRLSAGGVVPAFGYGDAPLLA